MPCLKECKVLNKSVRILPGQSYIAQPVTVNWLLNIVELSLIAVISTIHYYGQIHTRARSQIYLILVTAVI